MIGKITPAEMGKRKYLYYLIEAGENGKISLRGYPENFFLDSRYVSILRKFLEIKQNQYIFRKEVLELRRKYVYELYSAFIKFAKANWEILSKITKTKTLKDFLWGLGIIKKNADLDLFLKNPSKENLEKIIAKGSKESAYKMFFLPDSSYNFVEKLKEKTRNPYKSLEEYRNDFSGIVFERINLIEKNSHIRTDIFLSEYIQSLFMSEIINQNGKIREKDISNLTLFKFKFKEIYKKNKKYLKFDKTPSFEEIWNYLKNNTSWVISGITQGYLLKNFIDKKSKYFFVSKKIFYTNKEKEKIKNLITKKVPKFAKINFNKYDPSDVYLIKEDFDFREKKEKLYQALNIEEFNKFLLEKLKERKIIPYSIKKIEDPNSFIFLYVFNDFENEEEKEKRYRENLYYKVKNIRISFYPPTETKYVKFFSENIHIDNKNEKNGKSGKITGNIYSDRFELREFIPRKASSKSASFNGELSKTGSSARHGKIGEHNLIEVYLMLLDYYIEEVAPPSGVSVEELKKIKEEVLKLQNEFSEINLENIKFGDVIYEFYLLYKLLAEKYKGKIIIDDNPNFYLDEKLTFKDFLKKIMRFNVSKIKNNASEREIKNLLNEQKIPASYKYKVETKWIISKYKALKLTRYFLSSGSLEIFNRLLSWFYLFASSQLNISAPFVKPIDGGVGAQHKPTEDENYKPS